MEINEKQGSSGVAKAGLTTGIIGTSLGALAGLGELAGWGRRSAPVDAAASMAAPALGAALAAMVGKSGCSEDHTANRSEPAQEPENSSMGCRNWLPLTVKSCSPFFSATLATM